MTNTATLVPPRERAARGATRLDEARPDWFRDVDPDALDLNSTENCVLGQLYESYSEGLMRLKLRGTCCADCEDGATTPSDADLGFDVFYDREIHADAFTALTAAWRDEVTRRLAAEA